MGQRGPAQIVEHAEGAVRCSKSKTGRSTAFDVADHPAVMVEET
jgi:hypothetical protein